MAATLSDDIIIMPSDVIASSAMTMPMSIAAAMISSSDIMPPSMSSAIIMPMPSAAAMISSSDIMPPSMLAVASSTIACACAWVIMFAVASATLCWASSSEMPDEQAISNASDPTRAASAM